MFDSALSTQSSLADRVVEVVRQIISEIRPKLVEAALTGHHGETDNRRHADNFLSVHDVWLHGRYRDLLSEALPPFFYASEEAEPEVVGGSAAETPDLCIFVDPLDTSELAVRGLLGYTHILVYSRALAQPVVAVVGDLFHHVQLYVAFQNQNGQDVAYLSTAGPDPVLQRLRVRSGRKLSEALVTNYLMRPQERFLPLAQKHKFLEALGQPSADGKSWGRIGVDFGSVGLCHVAAGFTDAMVEFAKGFAVWDLYPGQYILRAAGGCVIDLNGKELPLRREVESIEDIASLMNGRQTFVAAGNVELAEEIRRALA